MYLPLYPCHPGVIHLSFPVPSALHAVGAQEMHIEAEQPATVTGAPYASGELPSFRTGAREGLASSVGLSALAGLSSRQKHPQSWLHQRGFVGPCWVVPWHFLGLQFRDLQVQDTWRVAPQGSLSGRCWPRVNVSHRRGWPGLLKSCLLACLPIQFEIILPSCPCLSPAQCPGQTFRAHRSFATPHTHPPSWRLGQHLSILPAQTPVPKGW